MKQKDKEKLRKKLTEEERTLPKPKCPCCGEEMAYEGFIFFDDPCFCGSGKLFGDCCFKAS